MSSFKRKKLNLKHRKKRKKLQLKNRLKSLNYRVAFHEIGHYVVKSKLKPHVDYRVSVFLGKSGELEGKLEEPNVKEGDTEALCVAGPTSIAGAVAETYFESLHVEKAFFLLKEHLALVEDREIFENVRGLERKRLEMELDCWSEPEYFQLLFKEVIKHFTDFGLLAMDRLARKLLIHTELYLPSA